MKGLKGKGKKGKKGKGKEKGKGKKENGEAKGKRRQLVASGGTRRPSAGSTRKTKEVNLWPRQIKQLLQR